MDSSTSGYDESATEYAAYAAQRESSRSDPILPYLLDLLGDIAGRSALDAACGEGYLARVLAARGAHVTGIDLSPRLIEMARQKNPSGDILYRVADLSKPVEKDIGHFDVIGSFLALNDVKDYRGFAATLASLLNPGGRLVLALNNPYGAVIRKWVTDYFDLDAVTPYRAFWAAGIKVFHHHRTLEQYLDAFLDSGLSLTKLADLSGVTSQHGPDTILPEGVRFPRFMLLAFTRPQRLFMNKDQHHE